MQKLLIHINFLLAFSVLFCSHSAFGQQSVSTQWPQNYNWTIVDLGLSVYWADRNVDASCTRCYGTNFTWSEAKDWNKLTSNVTPKWGGDWRTPSQSELQELINSLNFNKNVIGPDIRLTSSNGSFIDIPAAGFENKRGKPAGQRRWAYLWSSTQEGTSNDRAYCWTYIGSGVRPYTGKVSVITGDTNYKMPIRPVLDKCKDVTITVIYSDGTTQTTTSDYPKGTTIKITCDACHKYSCIEKKGSQVKETKIISNSNVTFEVVFSSKTTTVVATTKDNQKGTVEILEPIKNN